MPSLYWTRVPIVSFPAGARYRAPARLPGWRRLRLTACVVLGALCAVTAAAAGDVSFEAAEPEVRAEVMTVPLTIRNGGDEAVKQVTPGIRFRRWMAWGAVHRELPPNEKLDAKPVSSTGDLGIGRWPYCLIVDYAEPDGRRVQLLEARMLVAGNPPPVTVTVTAAAPPPLSAAGALRVQLNNAGTDARTVTVTVYLPRGIKVAEEVAPIELAAGEERAVDIQLQNRTHHPGQSYEIFVAAEYDQGPVHQAVVAPVTLVTAR
jgi:hypothetical protein